MSSNFVTNQLLKCDGATGIAQDEQTIICQDVFSITLEKKDPFYEFAKSWKETQTHSFGSNI